MATSADTRRVGLRFVDLHKSFGDNPVLCGVSFEVAPATVHFVMGRSGVGKSVLSRHVVGLHRPDAGQIWLNDLEVTSQSEQSLIDVRRRCQYIFQNPALFDQWTVLGNVAMPLRRRFGLSRAEANRRAEAALEKVHASALAQQAVHTLGVGVKKRISVARALALLPEVMLYDEPTTSLDPVAARRMDRLISETARALHLTSLVVSHDVISMRDIADRVTFLHQGRVRFDGPPQGLLDSHDEVIRKFVDASRVLQR